MIEIRPVWYVGNVSPQHGESIEKLLAVEQKIIKASEICFDLARLVMDEGNVDELKFLQRSAINDLVAGCELARTGYLKQTYSLWRSWFEQTIFILYFLEAPLHRSAWKVSSAVNQQDSPPYRLMLHQLLADSSEKHPFTLVYDSRYTALADALKISNTPKLQRPIPRATRLLTVLSQGVHGTYQPQAALNMESLCKQLDSHCLPVLASASEIVSLFWVLLFCNLIDFPQDILVRLREGVILKKDLTRAGLENVQHIAALAQLFAEAFPPLKHG